jgi:hypothetical protein
MFIAICLPMLSNNASIPGSNRGRAWNRRGAQKVAFFVNMNSEMASYHHIFDWPE